MKLIWLFLLGSCVAEIEYRLPKTVFPLDYSIIIQINQDSWTTDIFRGDVNITLNILEETQKIQLHSKELVIKHLLLNHTALNFTSDPFTDILTIASTQTLVPGTYNLHISYEGRFSPYDLHGFYKSSYTNEDGTVEFLAATQFEVTHARKAFPCFDEPSFKATFTLSLVFPSGFGAIANSLPSETINLGNHTMVRFSPTPVMSTYLNAFVISNYTCSVQKSDIQFRICSRNETSSDRSYALEISPKILKVLENYTGIPYSLDKMDQVTIPDFSANAMENWGLVTYREAALLWNSAESSNANKQRVASIIAHEFAHMWFGDLVTLKWWSDVFLNEGFARFFQYLVMAEVQSDWEMDKQFVVEQVQSALLADSDEAAALSSPVTTPLQISSKFNPISYNKGASILRMIAHMMGLEQCHQGIRHYLQTHKLNNTEPNDLWNSLENFAKLPFSLHDIVKNWTVQPGHPVLNVKLNNSKIVITQERFLLSGTSSIKYYIPITYTTSKDHEKFENTSTKLWLTPNQSEIILEENISDKSDWIVLNNQQIGFYRVNYDENLWNRIKSALKTDIHVLNKAQIVDDLFNFAKTNITTLSQVFDRISFLGESTEYYPWYSALNGFSYILRRINDQNIRGKFSNYVTQLMRKIYEAVPFSNEKISDQIYTLKQAMVLDWACKLGISDCVSNCTQIFADYKRGITKHRNLKFTTFCTSLRHSSNIEEDWNFLWGKFRKTKIASEQITILQSLGCTNNETILKRYLSYAIDRNSGIHRQDSNLVFSSVLTGHPNGIDVVLDFLNVNFEQVLNYYQNKNDIAKLVLSFTDRLTQHSQRDKLENFLHAKIGDGVNYELLSKILDKKLIMVKQIENQLFEYFKEKSNLAISIKSGSITLIVSAVYMLFLI